MYFSYQIHWQSQFKAMIANACSFKASIIWCTRAYGLYSFQTVAHFSIQSAALSHPCPHFGTAHSNSITSITCSRTHSHRSIHTHTRTRKRARTHLRTYLMLRSPRQTMAQCPNHHQIWTYVAIISTRPIRAEHRVPDIFPVLHAADGSIVRSPTQTNTPTSS